MYQQFMVDHNGINVVPHTWKHSGSALIFSCKTLIPPTASIVNTAPGSMLKSMLPGISLNETHFK